jgi:hypothetical protein
MSDNVDLNLYPNLAPPGQIQPAQTGLCRQCLRIEAGIVRKAVKGEELCSQHLRSYDNQLLAPIREAHTELERKTVRLGRVKVQLNTFRQKGDIVAKSIKLEKEESEMKQTIEATLQQVEALVSHLGAAPKRQLDDRILERMAADRENKKKRKAATLKKYEQALGWTANMTEDEIRAVQEEVLRRRNEAIAAGTYGPAHRVPGLDESSDGSPPQQVEDASLVAVGKQLRKHVIEDEVDETINNF